MKKEEYQSRSTRCSPMSASAHPAVHKKNACIARDHTVLWAEHALCIPGLPTGCDALVPTNWIEKRGQVSVHKEGQLTTGSNSSRR